MGLGVQREAPAALFPGKTRYSWYRRLGGPQDRSWRARKISPPPGFNPRTVEPVASRHTDWAFPAHYKCTAECRFSCRIVILVLRFIFNTLRTGDADLRFYITTVQDGWHKSAFLTRACFPCTIHLIMQYIEPVCEWSCWRMFIETWPHSELNFMHRASSI